MLVEVPCSGCRKPYTADSSFSGTARKCPACGTKNTVPAAAAPPPAKAGAPEAAPRLHRLACKEKLRGRRYAGYPLDQGYEIESVEDAQ